MAQVTQPVQVSPNLGARTYSNMRYGASTQTTSQSGINYSAASSPLLARTSGSSTSAGNWRQMTSAGSAAAMGITQGGAAMPGRPPLPSYTTRMTGSGMVSKSQVAAPRKNVAVPNKAIADIRTKHATIKSTLQMQIKEVAEVQMKMTQQIANWYFPALEVRASLEEALEIIKKLFDMADKYLIGTEKVFVIMDQMGPDLDKEWVEQLRKAVDLAETLTTKGAVTLASTLRISNEIEGDQRAYREAKAQQKIDTEASMEQDFNRLLHETSEVGLQANKILTQAVKEWSSILRTYCTQDKLPAALVRLNEVTAPTLEDTQNLGPEDIDTTMSDAHRCIEDVKTLFLSCNVPTSIVRQSVPPVQLAIFSCTNKAKSAT